MTGGQVVLSAVDFETFDYEKASRFRQKISKAIERLAVSVIRQFDLVVVRGNKSKAFLTEYGIEEKVAVITGSVQGNLELSTNRHIDLVFVGRLDPIKQVSQFIEIVHEISNIIPSVRAKVVGDGPLMADMRANVAKLKIVHNVEFLGKRRDVEEVLVCSKIFVLTSKSEGLSIALAEAMVAGAVPVVADVGELGDLVKDSFNGYLIEPDDIDGYVRRIISLLQDKAKWSQFSERAIEASKEYTHIDLVSERWHQNIEKIMKHRSKLN